MEYGHLPVLAEEVMRVLSPRSGSLQIDGTLGGGGHSERILEASSPDGRLLGLDADPAAIERAGANLARFGDRLVLRQANFRDLATVAPSAGFASVDGLLLDLGLSSYQLADDERGFSFRTSGALDMRFDPSHGRSAADILATSSTDELAALFRRYGEEPFAGRIARTIVEARRTAPIERAQDLAGLVERVVPRGGPAHRGASASRPGSRGRGTRTAGAGAGRRIHPATRVFQALRIAVNEELDALEAALAAAMDLLRPGGRLVVLSYHSLEDRIVKRFVAAERRGCTCPPFVPVCVCGRTPRLRIVGDAPTRPSAMEVASNPRSRSARLRAAERLAA
jgi:16S rRNA (cytosine1402-N4)-methyltransferase